MNSPPIYTSYPLAQDVPPPSHGSLHQFEQWTFSFFSGIAIATLIFSIFVLVIGSFSMGGIISGIDHIIAFSMITGGSTTAVLSFAGFLLLCIYSVKTCIQKTKPSEDKPTNPFT